MEARLYDQMMREIATAGGVVRDPQVAQLQQQVLPDKHKHHTHMQC